MKAVRAVISGRVQGVGFRDWTRREAGRLGVSGWVRNRDDGTVELVASGEAEAVDALLEVCREGPPPARPTGLEAEAESAPEASPPADAYRF
ncbi:MAG: acylphosphatase [Paracoccaceae bacterium]